MYLIDFTKLNKGRIKTLEIYNIKDKKAFVHFSLILVNHQYVLIILGYLLVNKLYLEWSKVANRGKKKRNFIKEVKAYFNPILASLIKENQNLVE